MLALYHAGRQADALDAYQRIYRLLDQELGVQPGRAFGSGCISGSWPLTRPWPHRPPPSPRTPLGGCGSFRRHRSCSPAVAVRWPRWIRSMTRQRWWWARSTGSAGIGKTALAVRLARRIAERYPHGQLFVDLHGHTPGMVPREPAEALDHLLRALGVPGPQIPADLDDRAALYRTRLADQKILILLDDAATETQESPLPGGPGCLVLITSRRRLSGLDPDPHAVAGYPARSGSSQPVRPDRRRAGSATNHPTWWRSLSNCVAGCRWRSASRLPGCDPTPPGACVTWCSGSRTGSIG